MSAYAKPYEHVPNLYAHIWVVLSNTLDSTLLHFSGIITSTIVHGEVIPVSSVW